MYSSCIFDFFTNLLALQLGGNTYAWSSSVVIGLFVGFGLTMLAFVPWQLYLQDTALIPPRLFGNRNASLIFLSSVFVNGPFQTIVYWLPIWFQAVLGVSPEASGIRYLPTVISNALASMIGAGIVMQLGIWNPFLLFAEVMVCLGAGLLTTIHPGISDGHWIGYQIFGGIGYSLASNLVRFTSTLIRILPKLKSLTGSSRYASVSSTRPRPYWGHDFTVWHLNQLRSIPFHRPSSLQRPPRYQPF